LNKIGLVDVLNGTRDANKKALFLRVWDTLVAIFGARQQTLSLNGRV